MSYSKEEWESKLEKIKVEKSELNELVMNYLTVEGYKDAAIKFSKETGMKMDANFELIDERVFIREAIQKGNIDEAIQRVNDLDPELIDNHPELSFHLQQQKLIEMLRNDQIDEALRFAQEDLSPITEQNPEFLDEMEKTMILFAIRTSLPSQISQLFDLQKRQKTASELNSIILKSQNQETEPKLPSLLKLTSWAQKRLSEKMKFPKINDFLTAQLE